MYFQRSTLVLTEQRSVHGLANKTLPNHVKATAMSFFLPYNKWHIAPLAK